MKYLSEFYGSPLDSRPLAELHVHLEGCVWDSHINRWWKKSRYLFHPPRLFYANDFEKFLEHLRFRYNFLNTPDAYARVVQDYMTQAVSNHIVYAEMLINIALIKTWHLDLETVLAKIKKRTKRIKHCPVLRFIIEIPWQFTDEINSFLFNNTNSLKKMGVVGIGFGGDEKKADVYSASMIVDRARDTGLNVVCHAGEITGYDSAIELVEKLKPDRVVHAISIADWIESMGTQSPPVDVCLSSNIQLNNIDRISNHPLMRWAKAGVPVNLSTDDPAIFNTSLRNEYQMASNEFDHFDSLLPKTESNALAAAFDKSSLKRAIKRYRLNTAEA